MRFEIRSGGTILILVGLFGLSGIVFAFGLIAGYEMGRQTSPETSQMASVYPLPNNPLPASEPSSAPSTAAMDQPPPAVKPPAPKPVERPPVASNPPPAPAPSVAARPPSIASANPPPVPVARPAPPPPQPNPGSSLDTGAGAVAPDTNPRVASLPSAPPPPRHKPFNIQIDAVMDRSNAEQMAARLQRLGYHAFLVPTDIGGQTWWRVRVGPFQSQEEASAAEQELRQKYRSTYTPQ